MEKTVPKPVTFKGAHEMPCCTVSVSDMKWNATGSWRYLKPGYVEQIPACQASCPASEPIERWLALFQKGEIDKAWETLTIENPFPGLMGRVCFHPCEGGCNRKDVGGAVTINMLERCLADEKGYNRTSVKPWKPSSGKKIAVVGSGPAGLACAYFSARLGHNVTVFEKLPRPGGLFRYGIPEYRLPKAVLDNELKKLHELGIKFECGKALGKNEMASLSEKFDAVLVAIGAHSSKSLGVPGEDAINIIPALEFLEGVQLSLENNKSLQGTKYEARGAVVVVGGGNSAVDAARMAKRCGAKSATILYRRSRTEMPAFEEEVNDAEGEGVKIEFLAAPKKVIAENGRVKAIECVRMKLGEADSSGRRSPIVIPGSEFNIPAEMVLTAIGEVVDKNTCPVPDGTRGCPAKDAKTLFGGDMLDQPRTVVNAIHSGKLSAIEMDCVLNKKSFKEVFEQIRIPETTYVRMARYLNLAGETPPHIIEKQKIVRTENLNTYYFDRSGPAPYPKRGAAERLAPNPFAEIHMAPDKKAAAAQIERCMHCGRCIECDNCFIYCPDVSIEKIKGGYAINYNYCKGCGVCVKECPRAAMEMTEEF